MTQSTNQIRVSDARLIQEIHVDLVETIKQNAIHKRFSCSSGSGNSGKPCRKYKPNVFRKPVSVKEFFTGSANPNRPCRGKKTSKPRSTSLANPDWLCRDKEAERDPKPSFLVSDAILVQQTQRSIAEARKQISIHKPVSV
eukprot:1051020-Pelagomonas_calceolata.AAC.1